MIFTRVTVRLILRIARTGWRSSSTDEIKSTPNVSFTHTIVCGVEHTQTQDSHVYDCIMFVKLILLALRLPRLYSQRYYARTLLFWSSVQWIKCSVPDGESEPLTAFYHEHTVKCPRSYQKFLLRFLGIILVCYVQ